MFGEIRMNTENEIFEFIKTKETNGALLITGTWGCGKTYLLKEIIKNFNDNKTFAIAIISLFGINSIEMLNHRIKEEYLELNSNFIGKTARKMYKQVGKIANASSSIVAAALPDSVAASAISTGVSSVFSFNLFDYISVKNSLGIGDNKRPFVLVFDDLERCKIPIIDLLGALNEYSENCSIKTIIIADETKIDKDALKDYTEFKEKLIYRTVKIVPEYDKIVESIISYYNETEPGYYEFLSKNINLIKTVFSESESGNLRSLKAFIIDFERVFISWKKSKISDDFLSPILYMFGAMIFGVKMGTYKKGAYGYLFVDEEMKKQYNQWQSKYLLSSLRIWVTEGKWDESDFIAEINNKFNTAELRDDQKFIYYDFWDLDQQIIKNGLPIVVEKAYEGKLTRDELINLIQKISAIKNHAIPIPCDVDYDKIAAGFKLRKEQIFAGKIEEPKCHIFSDQHQIEKEAYELYKDIKNFDKELVVEKNKEKYIMYLNKDSTISDYDFKRLPIGCFDDKLRALLVKKYNQSTNQQKRDIAYTFISLDFKDTYYSRPEDRNTTQKNLSILINDLKASSSSSNDFFTIAISNNFITQIESILEELKDINNQDAYISE